MNLIETQAKSFIKDLYRKDKRITIELLKDRLDLKLHNFVRDRDKLDFLKTLSIEVDLDFKNHIITCTNPKCSYDSQKDLSVFLIEQEIENINKTYTFVSKSEDKFTVQEETNLHNKLNDIILELKKQNLGQEILYEEIESLKSHFNLGKKNWTQLVFGKLFKVTVDKIIEKSVAENIIKMLGETLDEAQKYISGQN